MIISAKSFWWDAYTPACDIVRMMPTRTCRGWMSSDDCVPGGRTSNLSKLRRRGFKSYVWIPIVDHRMDGEGKAMVGYSLGYSKTKAGYRVILGDTVVTSVHILFDETIPERSADNFREHDKGPDGGYGTATLVHVRTKRKTADIIRSP